MQVIWATVQGWGLARFQTAKVSQDIWSPAENMARIFVFPKNTATLLLGTSGPYPVPWSHTVYGQVRNWTLAVQLFGDLERQRLEHDTVSVNSVLNAASQQRRYSKNLLEQLTFLLCLRLFLAFFLFSHCCTSQRFTSHREFLGFFLVKVYKSPKIQERCRPGGRFSNLQCSSKCSGFGGCCAAPGDDEGPRGFHEKKTSVI